jgi:poly(3-hydroxybutyrate) depolymerase
MSRRFRVAWGAAYARPLRSVRSLVIAFALLGSACSSTGSSPSENGGTHGGGGMSGLGGTSARGGQSGTGVSPGTAGTSSEAGTTGQGGGGQPGTGGVSDAGGRGGAGTGGSATAGQSGSAGAGTGGLSAGSGGAGAPGSGGRGGTGARGGAGGGAAGSPGGSGGTAGGSGGAGASAGAGGANQSAGCGRTRTLQNGTITISFNGASRKYILRVPDGYDSNHPYRLVLAYAWSGASASQVVSTNYFTFATMDGKNTIFAAPDAANGSGSWSNGDVAFTDAIVAQLEGDLCIDKTRLFATGFSFGGGMAMALACTRADVFRAVAFFSGADLTNSCPATLTKPIAYYASQASEDAGGMPITSPITGERKQAQFAEVNGCMPEPSSTNFPAAGQAHTCTNYKGCSAGHPTEYCVFNGPHGWEPKDPGQSTSWNAPEAWKFILQF